MVQRTDQPRLPHFTQVFHNGGNALFFSGEGDLMFHVKHFVFSPHFFLFSMSKKMTFFVSRETKAACFFQ